MTLQSSLSSLALGKGFTTEFKRTGPSNLSRAVANATRGMILPKLMTGEVEV